MQPDAGEAAPAQQRGDPVRAFVGDRDHVPGDAPGGREQDHSGRQQRREPDRRRSPAPAGCRRRRTTPAAVRRPPRHRRGRPQRDDWSENQTKRSGPLVQWGRVRPTRRSLRASARRHAAQRGLAGQLLARRLRCSGWPTASWPRPSSGRPRPRVLDGEGRARASANCCATAGSVSISCGDGSTTSRCRAARSTTWSSPGRAAWSPSTRAGDSEELAPELLADDVAPRAAHRASRRSGAGHARPGARCTSAARLLGQHPVRGEEAARAQARGR